MTHSIGTPLTSPSLEVSRLLFDLKKCARLIHQFSGCLSTQTIAKQTTDGLIEQFDCAFARLWLVEPDRSALKLMASSGLYTHITGSFAHVPMGAFKVGKIAQHCIPFLSNYLPQEPWVKDRQWAVDKGIQGFAGLPLMQEDKAIGVLAIFSYTPMAAEFLEVLQVLSVSVANALASATHHQENIAHLQITNQSHTASSQQNLSEILAEQLGAQKLSLLGTEQSLSPAIFQLLVRLGEQIAKQSCQYCRLVYEPNSIVLEAMLATRQQSIAENDERKENADWLTDEFSVTERIAVELGGYLKIKYSASQTIINIQLPRETGQADSVAVISSPLSAREQDVIVRLAHGLRDREISEQLFISDRTVKFHVKNILKKL
ncbi:MAG: GAF domain-containing protein, partial [Cyanobacteria bacterium P01_C01_bin.69]